MDFLPAWPLRFNDFLLFGILLGAGILGGQLAARTTFLPKITGYIAAGFVLGPSVLGLLDEDLLYNARVFTDIALGLILFEMGRILKFDDLRTNPWLSLGALLESTLSFILIYFALRLFDISAVSAAIAAAIGISSSPAVILLVTRQLKAQGPVTDRALTLVAMNNIVAFFVFIVILPLLHIEHQANWSMIVLQPLYQFAGSAIVAYVLALVLLWAARQIGKHESGQFALVVGMIVVSLGLSKMLHVSPLLMLLALGILSRNLDRRQQLMHVEFGHGGELFFLLLFVVAGASLHVAELGQAWMVALAFVFARLLAKSAALYHPMQRSGLTRLQSGMLGLTLVPMAGLAIGLAQVTSDMYPEFGRELSAIVLAAVALLETVGPIVTEFALKRAGEVGAQQRVEH